VKTIKMKLITASEKYEYHRHHQFLVMSEWLLPRPL